MARKKQQQSMKKGAALAVVAKKPSAPRPDEDEDEGPFQLALRPAGSAPKGAAKPKRVKKADRYQRLGAKYSAKQKKQMAEDAKARREEQARLAADGEDPNDSDYNPADGEEQEALDREADEEDVAYEEEIVPDDVDTDLVRVGQKRKKSAPGTSKVFNNREKERKALLKTATKSCNDEEKDDDGRVRQTTRELFYPEWIDDPDVQNVTLGRLCLERGWSNRGYNHINHCKAPDKRWYLRRWYTNPKNADQRNLPIAPPSDEEIAARVERAEDAVDSRAAKASRTKGHSAALVTTTHVAGVPPAVHEAMLAQQKTTDEKVKELEAEVARLNAKVETTQNDAKQSRAQLSNLRQEGQAQVRRMAQAVTNACGQAVMEQVEKAHQALIDAEAKATTPWDQAMAHAKRVNDQAVATAEAGAALKEKIVAALNVRHSEKGNHALVCAETSIGFLKNALVAFPNLLTAVEEGLKKDAALAKKEAKEQQQTAARLAVQHQAEAARAARDAAENAQIDADVALEMEAEAAGVYTFQGSLPLEA